MKNFRHVNNTFTNHFDLFIPWFWLIFGATRIHINGYGSGSDQMIRIRPDPDSKRWGKWSNWPFGVQFYMVFIASLDLNPYFWSLQVLSRSASTSSASGTGSAAAPLVANINVAVRVRYLGPGVVIFLKNHPPHLKWILPQNLFRVGFNHWIGEKTDQLETF